MKWLWKILRRAFFVARLIIWLVLLVVVGAYAYLFFIGAPRSLCDRVIRELAGRGVAVTFDDIKLELPAILTARNVTLGDTRTPDRPLVRAKRLGIEFDLTSLWRKLQSPVQALEVMDGTLSLPMDFDDPRSERVQADKLNGHIWLTENNVLEVKHVTADLCRLRLVLEGQLRLPTGPGPAQPKPPLSAAERERRMRLVRNILADLRSLQFTQAPVLTLRFDASTDDLATAEATLKIDAHALAHPKLAVDDLSARLRYGERHLYLDRFEATLGGGKLKIASADYDLLQNTGRAVVESSADPKVFTKFLPSGLQQQLAAWRFDQNPRFALTASYEADRFSLKSLVAQIASGRLIVSGQYDFKTGEAQAEVESHVDLKQLTMFMPKGWQRMLNEWRWNKNPDVKFNIYWREASPGLPTVTQGRIAVTEAAFRGIGIQRGACTGELRNNVLALSQGVVDLQPPPGQTNVTLTIRADYTCHLAQQDFSFSEVNATAFPMMLAPLYASNAVIIVREFEPAAPVTVTTGWWRGNWKRFETCECAGHFHSGPLEWRGLKTDAAECDFHYGRQKLTLGNVALQRPEGVVKGNYQHTFTTSDFTAKLGGTLDLLALTPILGDAARQVLARWHPEAPVDLDLRTVRGNWQRLGEAAVEGGIKTGPITAGAGHAKSLHARFTLDPAAINASEFSLRVSSGEVKGRVLFDRQRERLEFTGQTQCDFQPVEVAQLFGTNFVAAISPYRFSSMPRFLNLLAVADFKDWNQTTWSTDITAEHFEWWRLRADGIKARISYADRVVTISGFKTGQNRKRGFYGGDLEVKQATFDLRQPHMVYDVDLRLDDVKDGGGLLHTMFGYDKLSGTLHGNAHVAGKWEDYDSIQGSGELHLINAQLWSIPIFGGLSQVLGMIMPNKFTNPPAKDINTSFTVSGGYLSLPDPKREGDQITIRAVPHNITGRGKWRLGGELSFVFQEHILGETGPLSPVTKLFDPLTKPFEMELSGTLAKPQWRPRWLMPNLGGGRK